MSAMPAPAFGAPAELPYFVSLKSSITNVRVGPGFSYPVKWVFKRARWPVEVVYRYGNWRRIRDNTGAVGWIHAVMLSDRRFAAIRVRGGKLVDLREAASSKAQLLARLEANVLVRPTSCRQGWCHVQVVGHGLEGFVPEIRLWGVYPAEIF
ncbi:SH3 domain-containing protein [Ancylobacter mangrovi]|uniref:SH3 domain-containing protein n=1 Tax=Ancylobacter mangrovi TaxID=2972472 RepID=UPI0021621EEB|nr:SH3 domain-containing protein [Ancylobacter mangrovi]MCS0504133.1 SH3 domain-containing protein [Ancylobacter mangrovi]